MNELERTLADAFGPGLDRDWKAEARSIAARMHAEHGLPQLEEAAIEAFATGLEDIEFVERPGFRVTPIDKTAERAALVAVRKHAEALRQLLDPGTPFGRRFLHAAERALETNEEARRLAPKRSAPTFELDDGTKVRFPSSPVAGLSNRLAFASIVAGEESGRLKRTPQRRRGAARKADVIGRDLPDLYARIYPGAGVGTWSPSTEERSGPRHRFVQLCAVSLGFEPGSADAVEKAASRSRKRDR